LEEVTVGQEKMFVAGEYIKNVGKAKPVVCIFAVYTNTKSVQLAGEVKLNETAVVVVGAADPISYVTPTPKGFVGLNETAVGLGHHNSLSTRDMAERALIVRVVAIARFLVGLFFIGKFVK
jgi:hypothetical protein